MRVLFLVFLALLIGAFATSAGKMTLQLEKAWEGKSVNDLIATKGQPDQKLDDGQGGQIFVYSTYESEPGAEPSPGGTSSPGGGSGGGRGSGRHGGGSGGGGSSRRGSSGTTYLVHERFWIAADGHIYRVTYQLEGE